MARREAVASEGELPLWRERLRGYSALVGGNRLSGWMVVLWPIGWALWLAGKGMPAVGTLLSFIAGAILLRAASHAIDAYFGAVLDAYRGRIARFPPDSDRVAPAHAALVCAGLLLVVAWLVLALNPATMWLGASWSLLALGYLLVKRHLYLVQVYLGVLSGWGVLLAFAAVQGTVSHLGWTLFVATVFWATVCATWRAMADYDDDLMMGAKSIAILLGEVDLIGQGVLYLCMFIALMLVGRDAGLGGWYWVGLVAAVVLSGLAIRIARRREPLRCLQALALNGWIGMAIFIGIVLDFALRATVVNA